MTSRSSNAYDTICDTDAILTLTKKFIDQFMDIPEGNVVPEDAKAGFQLMYSRICLFNNTFEPIENANDHVDCKRLVLLDQIDTCLDDFRKLDSILDSTDEIVMSPDIYALCGEIYNTFMF